eukprot:Skav205675  [mRNA]  locus=scaffold458:717393:725997:+ [translate_table: standard]
MSAVIAATPTICRAPRSEIMMKVHKDSVHGLEVLQRYLTDPNSPRCWQLEDGDPHLFGSDRCQETWYLVFPNVEL